MSWPTEWNAFEIALTAVFAAAVGVFVLLWFVVAPYGRHGRQGWGPTVPAFWAWMVMESPSVIAFFVFYVQGRQALAAVPLLLLTMWQIHYVYRTFVYPFRIRSNRNTPATIVAMALCFNTTNAYLNATWIGEHGGYDFAWLGDPRFIVGFAMFAAGLTINRWADGVLHRLRDESDGKYRIPRGGLYERISCPNYFGEILEWTGWAVATWSLPGLAFALFTVANLLPRAVAHHRWYRTQFADYPKRRRAVLPYVL